MFQVLANPDCHFFQWQLKCRFYSLISCFPFQWESSWLPCSCITPQERIKHWLMMEETEVRCFGERIGLECFENGMESHRQSLLQTFWYPELFLNMYKQQQYIDELFSLKKKAK
uniref:Uncharacterized protein n=1 Tax=Micrurus paraensis TaxID=1970185 RepID=A0A2D4KZ99_9SAUR